MPVAAIQVHDPKELMKEVVFHNTMSGKPKKKRFCTGCGSTLFTIPMNSGGDIACLRSTLLDTDIREFIPRTEINTEARDRFAGESVLVQIT